MTGTKLNQQQNDVLSEDERCCITSVIWNPSDTEIKIEVDHVKADDNLLAIK